MKIYYYSGATLPSQAAKSVHVMKMCAAWGKAGHDVTLFAKGNDGMIDDLYPHYGVENCFKISRSINIKIRIVSGVLRVLLNHFNSLRFGAPDLIYGRDILAVTTAPFSKKIPRLYESHQLPHSIIHKTLIRFFPKIVAISQGLREDILRLDQKRADSSILIAHDGANIQKSSIKNKKLNKNLEKTQIGYAGSLQKGKGAHFLLGLAEKAPTAHFHIFGGQRHEIQHLKSLNPPQNISVYGHIPHGDIHSHLIACDILVAPYLNRATIRTGQDISRWISPMKLFEYMATQKPIISSDLPVIREILSHNENALLVKPEDMGAWLKVINTLQNDTDLGEKLGKQALDDLTNHYTWEKRAEKILNFCTQSS